MKLFCTRYLCLFMGAALAAVFFILESVSEPRRLHTFAQISQRFRTMDANQDGSVTQRELDANGDGGVSQRELNRLLPHAAAFASIDADRSGNISMTELAKAHRSTIEGTANVHRTNYPLQPSARGQVGRAARGTVLLTGGLGFIGSHVLELLVRRGYSVVVFDNESTGHNHNKQARREMIADVKRVSDLSQVGSDCRFVIHLAAAISVAESMKHPEKYTDNNVKGSQNVVDWAAKNGIRRMVAASSAAVYGNPDMSALPIKETQPYAGLSPYADSKYKMELLMRKAYQEKGLNSTALRFFNVFGPRQDPKSEYTGVISVFLDRANAGKEIVINGDGTNTRDFVYVGDVARAIVTAMESEGEFDVFNVCTGMCSIHLIHPALPQHAPRPALEFRLPRPEASVQSHTYTVVAHIERCYVPLARRRRTRSSSHNPKQVYKACPEQTPAPQRIGVSARDFSDVVPRV